MPSEGWGGLLPEDVAAAIPDGGGPPRKARKARKPRASRERFAPSEMDIETALAVGEMALSGDKFRADCRATLKRMRWAFGR